MPVSLSPADRAAARTVAAAPAGPAATPDPLTPRTPSPVPAEDGTPPFRGRMGSRHECGFPAAPYRYRLHLAPPCPASLRVAVTHRLLELGTTLPVTLLSPPSGPRAGHLSLRGLYEATRHRYAGPYTAPVLSDTWSGRIVSNDPSDIVRDLARCFWSPALPDLFPAALSEEVDAFEALLESHDRPGESAVTSDDGRGWQVGPGVLCRAEELLAGRRYLFGDALTAADVHLWSLLPAPGERPVLDAYRRRLVDTHPAFRRYSTVRTPPRPRCRAPWLVPVGAAAG